MARASPSLSSTPQFGRVIPGLNLQDFQNLLADWGVALVHYRAIPCPIGQVDQHDPRRLHHNHSGCQNGYIFEKAGELTCLFMGNGTQAQVLDTGQYFGSTVQVTFPPVYDDDQEKPVTVAPYDRLVLREHKGFVVANQRFTASDIGVDALQFPIEVVEALIDSDGKHYHGPKHPGEQGQDFNVKDGSIVWKGPKRPGEHAVCSVRYLYLPFWYVGKLIHEIRIVPTQDPLTGVREMQRWPYAALCHRENYGRDEQSDPSDPLKHREMPAPDATESDVLA